MAAIRKLCIGTILAVFALIILDSHSVQPTETIGFFQLYNPATQEHLYTTDTSEAVKLVRDKSWKSEGTGWISPVAGDPVYRVHNTARDDYIYTTSADEIAQLISVGWESDFGGSPVFYSGGEVPVYELTSNKTKRHYYTTSVDEYNALANKNWKQEGVAFSALEAGSPLAGPFDISNTDSIYAIQADVKLSGSGSGYHAKILGQTPTSAVSFGLQYDTGGLDSYKDNTGFIIENIYSNNKGEQSYYRPGLAESNKTYRLLLTIAENGTCTFYVNGVPVKQTVDNPNLIGQRVDMSVEGSGKHNGDEVVADFSNIKVKNSSSYDPSKWFRADPRDTNASIHSDTSRYFTENTVTISGTVSGLSDDQDWDNAYNQVSGITTFYE